MSNKDISASKIELNDSRLNNELMGKNGPSKTGVFNSTIQLKQSLGLPSKYRQVQAIGSKLNNRNKIFPKLKSKLDASLFTKEKLSKANLDKWRQFLVKKQKDNCDPK